MRPGLRALSAAAGPFVPEFLIARESYHGRKIAIGCEVFARNDSAGIRQRRRVLRHNARLVATRRYVLGAVFVRMQRGLAEPLIELRLFRAPAFSASLATFALSIFVIAGIFLFIAQYLQLVFGLSPLVAGLWTVPSSSGLIACSMLAPLVVRWVRPAFVMAGGLLLSAVGFGMLTQVDAATLHHLFSAEGQQLPGQGLGSLAGLERLADGVLYFRFQGMSLKYEAEMTQN